MENDLSLTIVEETGSPALLPIFMMYKDEHDKARYYYKPILRTMVSSYYAAMKTRIGNGNRIAAMLFRKIGKKPGEKIYINEAEFDDDVLDNQEEVSDEQINITESQEIQKAMVMEGIIIKDVNTLERELDDDAAEKKRKREEKEKNKMLKKLKEEYKRLADGIVAYVLSLDTLKSGRKRTGKKKIEQMKKIPNDVLAKYLGENGSLITDIAEWNLIIHYESQLAEETEYLKEISEYLENFPVWVKYLKHVPGVGPSLAGMMLSYIDISIADTISKLWAYCGLDTVEDPNDPSIRHGRSNHTIHLVNRPYIDKNGKLKTKKGLKYNKKLKTKTSGVLPDVFIQSNPHYNKIRADYKFRICHEEKRFSPDKVVFKTKNGIIDLDENDNPVVREMFPPQRLTAMAKRYMVKMFLKNMWISWRMIEGLPVTMTYEEKKLGIDCSKHVDPWGYNPNKKFIN